MLRKGVAVTSSKKLHRITAISDFENSPGNQAAQAVTDDFKNKWGCKDPEKLDGRNVLSIVTASAQPGFSEKEVRSASARLQTKYRLDHARTCIASLELLFLAHPWHSQHA